MKPEEKKLFTQSVNEADIDWLLCVELNSSLEFRRFIAACLFPGIKEFTHIDAYRSIVRSDRRESDLLWCINAVGQGRTIGLIENKIDAKAQPNQYRDYEMCGKSYVEKGYCQSYTVALVSPKGYYDTEKYPIRIYYEDIANWLKDRPDERSHYLARIFNKAIKKLSDPDEFLNKYEENLDNPEDESLKRLSEALLQSGYVKKLEGSMQFRLPSMKGKGKIILAIWNNCDMEIYFEQPERSLREKLIKKYVKLDSVQDYSPMNKDQYLFIEHGDWKKFINQFLVAFDQLIKKVRDSQ